MSQDRIEVLPIGTHVRVSDGSSGVIAAITIRQSGIAYNVVRWRDGTRHEEWLYEFEVAAPGRIDPLTIGFHP